MKHTSKTMPVGITIRSQIQSGDLARIVELHSQIYATEHGYDHTFEAYVAEALSQCILRAHPRERLWLVELDGVIQGCVAICEATPTQAQLRWFILSPELRGKRLGKYLLAESEAFCKQQGYSDIHLWTVKGLEAAKALYLQRGFTLTEEIEHHAWGAVRTEQRYDKPLL